MVRYDYKILNALLDSYEMSLLSRGENKVSIHIQYVFSKKNLPNYYDESSLDYEEIHACVKELEHKNFISVVWKQGKENHIIQKVLLNENAVQDIYDYLKRVPKSETEKTAIALLSEWQKKYNSPVAGAFIEYLTLRLQEGKPVKEYIDISDPKQTEQLIRAIFCIETNKQSCYLREFSIRCFQDSKIFETLLGKITKVWKNFGLESGYDTIDSILAEHYIYGTPNYIYVKGSGILKVNQQKIDLEEFSQGIGISGEDLLQGMEITREGIPQGIGIPGENLLQGMEITREGIPQERRISEEKYSKVSILGKASTRKVITIENLTTFFRWEEKDSMIIYLGGYHNSVRRQLLKRLYEQMPQVEYLHFGDIDVGGFEIYEDLCKKTEISFQLYHMGIVELEKYQMYAKKLTDNDKKRLDKLIQYAQENECKYVDVLHYMRSHNIKLEQECIGPVTSHAHAPHLAAGRGENM